MGGKKKNKNGKRIVHSKQQVPSRLCLFVFCSESHWLLKFHFLLTFWSHRFVLLVVNAEGILQYLPSLVLMIIHLIPTLLHIIHNLFPADIPRKHLALLFSSFYSTTLPANKFFFVCMLMLKNLKFQAFTNEWGQNPVAQKVTLN